MKLIMENFRKFLNEEEFRYLSEEEFDALSAEDQLAYAKKFMTMPQDEGSAKRGGGYYMNARGYKDPTAIGKNFHKGAKLKFAKGTKEFRALVWSDEKHQLMKRRAEIPDWIRKVAAEQNITFPPGVRGREQSRALGYAVKEKWQEVVDPQFVNRFKWVHAFQNPQWFKDFLEGKIESIDEISVIGYLDKVAGRTWGDIGVLVKGTPTLIGGQDMATDNVDKSARKVGQQDLKYSGVYNAFLTSDEEWKDYKSYGKSVDEALLVDWEIQAIVLTLGKVPEGFEEIVKAASKKYPILDRSFQKVS